MRPGFFRLFLMILLCGLLPSCSALPSPFGPTPTPPLVAARARFDGPVRMGDPVRFTIAVTTRQAHRDVEITVFTGSPNAVIAEPATCYVDTRAGKTASCSFTVQFKNKGDFHVVGMIFHPDLGYEHTSLQVRITPAGATLNPPSSGRFQEIETAPPRTPTAGRKAPTATPQATPTVPASWSERDTPTPAPFVQDTPVGTPAAPWTVEP